MTQTTVQQALELAIQHHRAGELHKAEVIYRQVLQQIPSQPDALLMLGMIAHQAGKNEPAIDLIKQAITAFPQNPDAHNNLGICLMAMGKLDEAQTSLQNVIKLNPNLPMPHFNLGMVLARKNDHAGAAACFRKSIELRPDSPAAHNDLGLSLQQMNQLQSAIDSYRTAIRLQPDFTPSHFNLANALCDAGQLDHALQAYHATLKLNPSMAVAHNNLGNVHKDRGEISAALACYRNATKFDPTNPKFHSNLVYAMSFDPACDQATMEQEQRRWQEKFADPNKPFILQHLNSREPNRKLNLGYVSPDFCDHVVGRNVLPIFKHHDRRQFHITCYSGVARADSITTQFQQLSDRWRDINSVDDIQAAEMIRRDGIDILIDLTLHMTGNRLRIFTRRPAPVQISFAGYPGSTGLDAIDYRLSDPYLDPTDADRTVRLPHTFWSYDPLADQPQPAPLPALSNGYITFGCLNNFCKVNDSVLKLWSRVLLAVPGSHLIILSPQGSHRGKVVKDLGVDPQRIQFVEFSARQNYLQLYHQIDIGLDTFPYNGHTTSLDGLWMGVPTITLVGRTIVGRAGFSQLSNVGLTELAAHSQDEFVRIASELALDVPRLSRLRGSLRQRMQSSPLMNAVQFTRDIEAAYRWVWQKWCDNA